jgi:hypothetical protein
MAEDNPFVIPLDVGKLKSRRKDSTPAAVAQTDAVAEKHGFVERGVKKRRGRRPSPRTGQVHAKVMPDVAKEIAREARDRGVQQGVLIEEAWALYKSAQEEG